MDRDWWKVHRGEVETFEGELISPHPNCFGARRVAVGIAYRNSGAGAIALAAHFGATRIILLGYDCQKTEGKAHWHGDHPRGLGNAGSVAKWPAQFQKLAQDYRGLDIVNATRHTALTCFPLVQLEYALRDNDSDMAMGRESGIYA